MSKNCNNLVCDNSMIDGNSIDVILEGCDSEVRADVIVSEFNSIRLWGQVRNCDGDPVSNVLCKLVKVVKNGDMCQYQGIAHTVSDCEGFYQFDICVDIPGRCYKVLVNKSAVGIERIISTGDGNCDACTSPGYNPCGEYKYRVTPADKINCKQKSKHECKDQCDECYI